MYRKIPSLQSIVCFEAAARHHSYTGAANELSLTQGAVSRQVASLEEFLGVQLFRRTRHGMTLTPAGAGYARQAALRLQGLERDALDAMAGQVGGGSIHLAAVPTFATRWLLPRVADLSRRHPHITLHIDANTSPFLFADLEYEAAIYAGTVEQLAKWPGTQATLLMHEDVVPVASPQLLKGRARWRPADIARLPLLQQSTRPDAWRQWFDSMNVDATHPLHGPRYQLFSMHAEAATHGLGVALLPPMLVEAELRRGELRIVCDAPLRGQRAYYLVTPDSSDEKPALTEFRDWLQLQAAAAARAPVHGALARTSR